MSFSDERTEKFSGEGLSPFQAAPPLVCRLENETTPMSAPHSDKSGCTPMQLIIMSLGYCS